jgi:hypothetical protein
MRCEYAECPCRGTELIWITRTAEGVVRFARTSLSAVANAKFPSDFVPIDRAAKLVGAVGFPPSGFPTRKSWCDLSIVDMNSGAIVASGTVPATILSVVSLVQ